MATTITVTRQVVEDYQRLFVNRRAYTIQSMRPHQETGRHYYFRPSKKGTGIPLMLTEGTIRQHLEGKITVGLYAINPSTQPGGRANIPRAASRASRPAPATVKR